MTAAATKQGPCAPGAPLYERAGPASPPVTGQLRLLSRLRTQRAGVQGAPSPEAGAPHAPRGRARQGRARPHPGPGREALRCFRRRLPPPPPAPSQAWRPGEQRLGGGRERPGKQAAGRPCSPPFRPARGRPRLGVSVLRLRPHSVYGPSSRTLVLLGGLLVGVQLGAPELRSCFFFFFGRWGVDSWRTCPEASQSVKPRFPSRVSPAMPVEAAGDLGVPGLPLDTFVGLWVVKGGVTPSLAWMEP